jgi:hypothetical protein
MSKNILLITEQTFKERTGASNNIDGKQIFPMVKVAGDMFIQPVLGSTLYKRLQTGIVAKNLNAYETTLIDDYITDALIWYTMSMLPMSMGYQLFSKGFLQKTSDDSVTPSRADLELIEQKYKSMAEFYSNRMVKYLQENYTLYSEYLNYGMGLDVIFPEKKVYTSPIYLGGADENRRTWLNQSISSGSSNLVTQVAYYTATANQTTFQVTSLIGKTVVSAFRSGLNKVIVTTTTNDTGKLQIVNGTVTLPTGDVTIAGELFTFLYNN